MYHDVLIMQINVQINQKLHQTTLILTFKGLTNRENNGVNIKSMQCTYYKKIRKALLLLLLLLRMYVKTSLPSTRAPEASSTSDKHIHG